MHGLSLPLLFGVMCLGCNPATLGRWRYSTYSAEAVDAGGGECFGVAALSTCRREVCQHALPGNSAREQQHDGGWMCRTVQAPMLWGAISASCTDSAGVQCGWVGQGNGASRLHLEPRITVDVIGHPPAPKLWALVKMVMSQWVRSGHQTFLFAHLNNPNAQPLV